MKIGLIFFACLSVVLGTMARADEEEVVRRLSGYHFGDESWNYVPVHDPSTGLVDAIVAIAKAEATIGDNLNTVLFLRVGNEFEAWSWRNTTRGYAVYSTKMILNVSDDDDALWQLEEELPWLDENAIRPPTPYMAGMLTDDPLFEPVMESENPTALVEMLAELGYSVSLLRPTDGGGETGHPPTDERCDILLGALASGYEWAIAQEAQTPSEVASVVNGMSQFSVPYCGDPTCRPKRLSPWSEGPWVPLGGCSWSLKERRIEPIQGGAYVTCVYEAKKSFVKHRTAKYRYENCQELDCDQFCFAAATSEYPMQSELQLIGDPLVVCAAEPPGIACTLQPAYSALSPDQAQGPWQPTCP